MVNTEYLEWNTRLKIVMAREEWSGNFRYWSVPVELMEADHIEAALREIRRMAMPVKTWWGTMWLDVLPQEIERRKKMGTW